MDNIKKSSENKTLLGNNNVSYIITVVVALINVATILLYDNPIENQVIIGLLILLTSVMLIMRVKRARILFFLISIITYINTSIAIIDCIYGGEMLNAYQWALRHSEFNQAYAKSILLNITIISLMITPNFVKKSANLNKVIEHKNNPIIVYVGIAFIIYAMIFGFYRVDSIGYVSNAKPLYEYAILVFILAWHYSGENKIARYILGICALIYILQGLYYGDRSSALVLMVLIGMVYINKTSVSRMMIFAITGIVFANVVAIFRDSVTKITFSDMLNILLNKGILIFFSDTASFSYYAGITIVASRLSLPESPLYYLNKFLLAILLGGSSHLSEGSDITIVARQVYANGGGGLYPSYFYFWGEYIGVIIGAIILGFIIRHVFISDKPYNKLMQYCITIMSFRWYLYTPMTFFRTSIFVFSFLYLLCFIFNMIKIKNYPKNYEIIQKSIPNQNK
jgi:hypothetical protein